MVSVTVDIKPLEKDLKKWMRAFHMTSENSLDALAMNMKSDAQGILNSNGTNNTGALSNSIYVEKIENGRIVATETGYGLYVEFGRPAGDLPPWMALARWVLRKLGLRGDEAYLAIKFIRLKIKRKGTKAQPFLRPAFEKARKRMVSQYQKEFKRQK